MISIIIPHRNSPERLKLLLNSIEQSLFDDYEIIVVDDASNKKPSLPPMDNRVSLHHLPEQRGPAYARNFGVSKSKGDIILFLDADVIIPGDLLTSISRIFARESEISAINFINSIDSKDDGIISSYGALIEYFWFSKLIPPSMDRGDCPGATTRNLAIRKSVLEKIGGFSTEYRTNAIEDYEFGKRLTTSFKSIILSNPKIYHHFPDKLTRLLRNYFLRTALYVKYWMKYKPKPEKVQITGEEMMNRLLAGLILLFAILSFFKLPFLIPAIILFILYLWKIRKLLAFFRWHKGTFFMLASIFIHFVSSLAIIVGGVYGIISSLPYFISGKGK